MLDNVTDVQVVYSNGASEVSTVHISQVAVRTALSLTRKPLHYDRYHNNIVAAAREMVRRGHAGWLYVTQAASGMTVWKSKGHRMSIERRDNMSRTCDECGCESVVYGVSVVGAFRWTPKRWLCWTCYWTCYQLQYADDKLVVADIDTGEIVLETERV